LFFQFTPGLNYFDNIIENNAESYSSVNDIVFSLGAGLGFDIGVSNLVTITPLVNYHYYFGATWDGLAQQLGEEQNHPESFETTNLQQFFAGIRVGIRLDQRNYGFR
jgi:hypothetical protein